MEGAQEMLTTALWNQVTFPLIKTGNDLNWHNYCQEELRIPELSFLITTVPSYLKSGWGLVPVG